MCYVHFLASRPSRETPNFKQHVAGIKVSGLFDLKKDHAVFAFALADILADGLRCLKHSDMGGDREGRGAGGPDLFRKYYKLSFIP